MTPQEQADEDELALAEAEAAAVAKPAAAEPPVKLSGPSTKEKVLGSVLAFTHGAGAGLTDELAGAFAAGDSVPEWFRGGPSPAAAYRKARDSARSTLGPAIKENPWAPTYGASITALAGAPATLPAQVGLGAYQGGLGAFGSSEGDAERVATDTVTGAGLGAGVSGAMGGLSKGYGWLASKVGRQGDLAEDVIRQKAQKAAESGARSETTYASHESAENGRKYALAQDRLTDPTSTPQQIADAEAAMNDPGVVAWLNNRRDNAVSGLASGAAKFDELSQRAKEAWANVDATASADAANKIANPGQPLNDAGKRQFTRLGVGLATGGIGALGGKITNELGLTEDGKSFGGIGGFALGSGATGFVNAFRNNMGNPQTQLMFNRGVQSLLSQGQKAAPALGSALAREAGSQTPSATPGLRDLLALSQGQQFDPQGRPFALGASTPPNTPPPQTQRSMPSQDTPEEEDAGVRAFQSGGI